MGHEQVAITAEADQNQPKLVIRKLHGVLRNNDGIAIFRASLTLIRSMLLSPRWGKLRLEAIGKASRLSRVLHSP